MENIASNIQAAFVLIAPGVRGYFPLQEAEQVIYASGKAPGSPLRPGDQILVQVSRDAMKGKLPALTSNLNFTGRYLVLTTGDKKFGLSSKLALEDRHRLSGWLKEEAERPDKEFGIIVRTNAADASKEEILKIAVDGAKLLKKLADETEGNFAFEYSPESFTGTEPEYALEVCNAVLDVWQPTADNKCIINLPSTVQNAMPHVYASQIEYMSKNMKYRENVLISLHPHNDRGCGISDAEMGLLAGADRIEGTLFGNGERTGNVDIVTLALNMYSQGVDPKLDFSDMPRICEIYEECTGMKVGERSPYSGALVFAAFSGSHQDAIAKGMHWREEKDPNRWTVPYLPIDPTDVGRNYDADVIRINSVSGKGGVAFVLKQQFGFSLPAAMKEEVGYLVKGISDRRHQELLPKEIYAIFEENYIYPRSIFNVPECHFKQENGIQAEVTIDQGGASRTITTMGNGRLDAVSNAIKTYFGITYELSVYEEHAISRGSNSKAATYVGIVHDGKFYWGVGVDEDIIKSSIAALVSAVNKLAAEQHISSCREERIVEIISFIQKNYVDVTLDMLVDTFHLSKPYLSKYIKEKAGMTFQEVVREERMKKARMLLKETNQTVETIAANVGYENVEHFNRLFKKAYDMTPVQYRKQSAE